MRVSMSMGEREEGVWVVYVLSICCIAAADVAAADIEIIHSSHLSSLSLSSSSSLSLIMPFLSLAHSSEAGMTT